MSSNYNCLVDLRTISVPSSTKRMPRSELSTLHRVLVNGQERYSFVIDNQVLSRINKEACWTISNITAGNKGEIQVVLDAHNGLTSTMKPGANWVDMHLLEWMYVFYGVRKIWEEG
ncbi:importin subunit alpha-5 [Quercus suber]|uniref:Importin subunit alpha-5 n=1 Tax=Quercus suber TaxID=58331 RepID=A0AAW0LW26_QUESU